MIYTPFDGLRYHLEKRHAEKREDFPPDRVDYTDTFRRIEEYLNQHVHPEVVTGAALEGYGLLNDHGKEHVSMVIHRAGLLLQKRMEWLTGYEIYLLLLAIHFHDIGNIYGRDDHERRIQEVMEELGDRLPMDNPSKEYVALIAMAHGGKINDSKDTISSLNPKDYLMGQIIHPAQLASILRFADEIADDSTRCARFLMDAGRLPEKNQAFHFYSKCLEPAAVTDSTLVLKYHLPKEWATRTCQRENAKDSGKLSRVYLYDEILSRIRKCLCELEYCRMFARGFIQLDSISAKIQVNAPNIIGPIFEDNIRMCLKGYPITAKKRISELVDKPLKSGSGCDLRRQLEGKR